MDHKIVIKNIRFNLSKMAEKVEVLCRTNKDQNS